MVPPRLSTDLKTPYRIEKDKVFLIGVFYACLAVLGRIEGLFPVVFVLIPLGLLFINLNAYRFLVLLFAGFFLFFPAGAAGTTLFGIFAADSLAAVFLLLFLLSQSRTREPASIPISFTLAGVYVFAAYALVLSYRSLPTTDFYRVTYDLKSIFYLLFVPILLMLDGKTREPKKFFLLLSTFVLFCSIHSLEVLARFIISPERVVTWNEIFISDSVLISALMLRFPVAARTKMFLWVALFLSTLGLLLTQTRGLWLSTLAAFALFYTLEFFTGKNLTVGKILKTVTVMAGGFLAANVLFMVVAKIPLHIFIRRRFGDGGINEFIDPFASMGYRIHESLAVWTQRTVFGHGTGASLHLYFTQLNNAKFMDWWSIHSGYFEVLHKFGFVGLALFLWLFGAYYFLGRRLAKSPSRVVATFGGIIATVIINHTVVSITSGYFFRHASIVWLPLFFIAERLRPRRRNRSITGDEALSTPPTDHSPEERESPA